MESETICLHVSGTQLRPGVDPGNSTLNDVLDLSKHSVLSLQAQRSCRPRRPQAMPTSNAAQSIPPFLNVAIIQLPSLVRCRAGV